MKLILKAQTCIYLKTFCVKEFLIKIENEK